MGYAKANGWAATFIEESTPAAFAGFLTTVNAAAASAMHAEQYLADNAKEIYDTALATWPTLSADMQANFKSSMTQMADGIIVAGDWLTAGLDALKAKFGTTAPTTGNFLVRTGDGTPYEYELSGGYVLKFADGSMSGIHSISRYMDFSDTLEIKLYHNVSSGAYVYEDIRAPKSHVLLEQLESINSPWALAAFINIFANPNVRSLPATVFKDGVAVPMPEDNIYNRMDEWLRDVAIPAGNLGIYNPSHAWTDKGYRLGLSTDGQNLLTLPDGLPYDPTIHGDYTWRPPLTQVIDGVPAVLDPLTWDWVNVRDRTKVRPAEIPEIAEYVGTDIDTAEKIRERDKGEGGETGTTGGLKNPTKKLVWTPLMMAGTAMTTKFPFSLPWDLMKQLQIFDVAPKAPEIEINVPNYLQMDGLSIPFQFTLDLSMFDKVATMVRWFNVIIWDIALILILRKLLPE